MYFGARTYQHIQSSAASTWTINHNLGHKPVSDAFVDTGGTLEKVFPVEVKHVDDNTLVMTFAFAVSGQARVG